MARIRHGSDMSDSEPRANICASKVPPNCSQWPLCPFRSGEWGRPLSRDHPRSGVDASWLSAQARSVRRSQVDGDGGGKGTGLGECPRGVVCAWTFVELLALLAVKDTPPPLVLPCAFVF
jgi:hypothetical protein